MNVGFYLITRTLTDLSGYVWANAMLRSVRRVMPGVPVVQFTDADSPNVNGVDEVRRLPSEPMARLRLKHQAAVSGEWLFLDTDVIVQRDVRPVFKRAFDVAVTTREWPHLRPAEGFSKRMPYNTGVVFSRCPAFWREAYELSAQYPPKQQQWMGDQRAICELAIRERAQHAARYQIIELNGSRYNLPPACFEHNNQRKSDKFVKQAHIVHYKGPERKAMLLERIECG